MTDQPNPPLERNKQEKIAQTAAEAQKLADALQRVLDPYIDALDENGADEKTAVQFITLLVGVRAFIGRFEGVERVIVPALVQSGQLTEAAYRDVCRTASTLGVAEVEVLRRLYGV